MNSGQKIIFFFLLITPFMGFCQNPVEVNQKVDYFILPEPNWAEVKISDSLQPGNRVSVPVLVDLNLQNSGKWSIDQSGYRRWNLTIEAANSALALAALLDTFSLSDGAVLSVFIENNDFPSSRYIGTEGKIEKKLLGFFSSNKIRLELIEPPLAEIKSVIHIFRMDIGYKPVFDKIESNVSKRNSETLGFGASEVCHTNIICPEGDIIQKEKNGICRIYVVVKEGIGFCTGNLVNNTKKDGKPLVLSAFHCQDGYTPMYDFWRFDFNYQSQTCNQPASEPVFSYIQGAKLLAGRLENDFLLFELSGSIPSSFNPYFLGWNRSTMGPQKSKMAHHPKGDIKKIAVSNRPAPVFTSTIKWDNNRISPANHHFVVQYTFGSFEIGSSGCALLNESNQLTGLLHGGSANCTVSSGYFSRFSLSWEGGGTPSTRLKDWLDPILSDSMQIMGLDNPMVENGKVAGVIYTETNTPIPNTNVILIGDNGFSVSTVSDAQGNYSFSGLSTGKNYILDFAKSSSILNGLSTFDLLQVQKHILNREILKSPFKMLAADVNNSGSISTSDLILLKRALLGLTTSFEKVPIWQFVPFENGFMNIAAPLLGLNLNAFMVQNLQSPILDKDFIGVKAGDINNSASVNE
jgi:lysyl endopeptidase